MLRIKNISIENYKSINNEIKFDLDNWNILLGQNEAGKSNIINAIHDIWNYFDYFKNIENTFYKDHSNFFIGKQNKNPIKLTMYFSCDDKELNKIRDALINLMIEKLIINEKCKHILSHTIDLNNEFYLEFSIKTNNDIKIKSNLINDNNKNIQEFNNYSNCVIKYERKDPKNIDFKWDLYDEFKDLNFNTEKIEFTKLFQYLKAQNQMAFVYNPNIMNKYNSIPNIDVIKKFIISKIDNNFFENFNNSTSQTLKDYFDFLHDLKEQEFLNDIETKNKELNWDNIVAPIKEFLSLIESNNELTIWKQLLNFNCVFWKYSEDFLLEGNYDLNEYENINNIPSIPLKNILKILFSKIDIDDYSNWIKSLQDDSDRLFYSKNLSQIINNILKKSWYIFEDQNYNIEVQIQDNLAMKIKIQQSEEKFEFDKSLFNNFINRSDGFKRFASYALCLNDDIEYKNKLILIDELETHLHLDAFVNLLKYIDEISNSINHNYTFLVSTLSPFIFNKTFKNLNYFLVSKKNNLSSEIEKIRFKSFLDYSNIVGFNIFDFLIKPDFLILVEGDTDKEFWSYILSQKNHIENFLIWSGKGASTIFQNLKDFKEKIKNSGLELKNVHAIYDFDAEGKKQYDKLTEEVDEINIHFIKDFFNKDAFNNEDFVLEDIYNRNLIIEYFEKNNKISEIDKNNFLECKNSIINYEFYKIKNWKMKLLKFLENEESINKFNIDEEKIKNTFLK